MKKFLPIIIGVVVGVMAGGLMIHDIEKNTAYGVGNTWSTYNFFEWNEIFSPNSQGQNLYNLVYNKRLVSPEKDAIKEIAQKYGLTQEEARQAVDGSLSIVLNGPGAREENFGQKEAVALLNAMQEDFEFLSTVFELEQEIDLSLTPSEMFANGDIFDSGFDLVHDLTIIEEILFVETTENSVGGTFSGLLTSPYLEPEDEFVDIPDEGPGAILSFAGGSGLGTTEAGLSSEDDGDQDGSGGNDLASQDPIFNLPVGDEEVEVSILSEDICEPTYEDYGGALSQFEQDKADESGGGSGGSGAASGGSGSGIGGAGTGGLNPEIGAGPELDEDGNILAAAPGEWGEEWCPGFGVEGGSTSKNLAMLGFIALGDGDISEFNPGVAESFSAESFVGSIHAAFCSEVKFIKKRVSAYDAGQGCIACEVETINEYLEKTLSHSLIPNKTTGNLMESGKCKDGYSAGIDMQFITIANPIPTPPNDEIINEPNLIEEWNSFVNESIPFVKVQDPVSTFEIKNTPEGASQDQVLASIIKQQNADRAEAQFALETAEVKADFANTAVYSQEVLVEVKQMNNYFKNFSQIYVDIDENACQDIKKKPDLD